MSKLQLLKEPGFVYDLLSVFTLQFNKQLFINNGSDDGNQERLVRYFEDHFDAHKEIPDDLSLFFSGDKDSPCFMATFYYNQYADHFNQDYDVKFLVNALSDRPVFLSNMIRYYLPDLEEEAIESCMQSAVELFARIKASAHSDTVKKCLYEFFMNPEPYIQALQYELMQKSVELETYYKENYEKILDAYNRTTLNSLIDRYRVDKDLRFLKDNRETVYVSFCLLNEGHVSTTTTNGGFLFVLGEGYDSVVEPAPEKPTLDLKSLGDAFCEKSRAMILDLLLEKGAQTCKDLEKAFDFSGSTAYHHVTILVRTGAVKTHNEGKTIFYSVNYEYFISVVEALKKYIDKRTQGQE